MIYAANAGQRARYYGPRRRALHYYWRLWRAGWSIHAW